MFRRSGIWKSPTAWWSRHDAGGSPRPFGTVRSPIFWPLDIAVDSETTVHAWSATLALAERHRLTLYDAAYLELAQRSRLPLATLDRQLREAGVAAGVPLLGLAP